MFRTFFKEKRVRSKSHLVFLRDLPCVRCGWPESEASHIRIYGKGGTALKTADNTALPLCHKHHMESHDGERTFWGNRIEEAITLANALYVKTGDHAACNDLIARYRRHS